MGLQDTCALMQALVQSWLVQARRYRTTGNAIPGYMLPFGAAQCPAWVVMPGIPWIVTGMLLYYLFLRRGERLAGTPHGSKDLSPKGHCLVLGELESPSASASPDTASPLLHRTVRAGSCGDQARGLVLGNEGAQGR